MDGSRFVSRKCRSPGTVSRFRGAAGDGALSQSITHSASHGLQPFNGMAQSYAGDLGPIPFGGGLHPFPRDERDAGGRSDPVKA
jgi:hypothetical protein